jgi:hypothetical protein
MAESGSTSDVIPGHRAAMNPESRDSGLASSTRPGMTVGEHFVAADQVLEHPANHAHIGC